MSHVPRALIWQRGDLPHGAQIGGGVSTAGADTQRENRREDG